ncbi:hypothetical protein OQA88_1894 [Cercophora sp. LCS_1]
MFEIPDAKRVRRQDLYDSASDRGSSPDVDSEREAELRAKLNAQLSSLLQLDVQTDDVLMQDDDEKTVVQSPPEQEEFEFRLFSTLEPSKIVLVNPEDEKHNGPPISVRPISFYVRGELSPEERERFEHAAVNANQILAEAKKRAWGLEVPWRVTRIIVRGKQQTRSDGKDGETKGRKRPGKKRRIAIRIKTKAAREKAEAEEKQKMTKEEHLREKKKRLNRAKQIKRRQKAKEQKMAATMGEGGGDGNGEGVSSDDAES